MEFHLLRHLHSAISLLMGVSLAAIPAFAGETIKDRNGYSITHDFVLHQSGGDKKVLDALFAARPRGPSDPTTPTAGQEAVVRDATARTLDQNIRDAILEAVLPQLPGAAATFAKKGRG